MWNMLQDDKSIFSGLLQAYDQEAGYLNIQSACNLLASRLYSAKYASHLKVFSLEKKCDIQFVMGYLKHKSKSSLSERTKEQLPSPERVDTTFRNINWLLQYWMCKDPLLLLTDGEETSSTAEMQRWNHAACFPDPISEEFGFTTKSNGKVAWLDDVSG